MRETERSELVLANVTMETRGWSEARKGRETWSSQRQAQAGQGLETIVR